MCEALPILVSDWGCGLVCPAWGGGLRSKATAHDNKIANTTKKRAMDVTFNWGARLFSQSEPPTSQRRRAGNCTRDVESITHERILRSLGRTTTCAAPDSALGECSPCKRETGCG